MAEHCWHNDGPSGSWMTGGYTPVRCCWCGATGRQEWWTTWNRLDGHGPNYAAEQTSVMPVQMAHEQPCVDRTHHPPPPGFNDSEGDEG